MSEFYCRELSKKYVYIVNIYSMNSDTLSIESVSEKLWFLKFIGVSKTPFFMAVEKWK